MTLSIPKYLKAAKIQDKTVRYKWDDWKTIEGAETPDKELVACLLGVSQRAVLAFGCGAAEWLVYRFGKLCDDQSPWDYLVAAWAMVVDVRYCGYGDATTWQEYASPKVWTGPVKRPIQDMLKLLEIAFQQLAWEFHTDPTRMIGVVAAHASYVMTDPAPFKKWCKEVLDRFEELYPRNPKDTLGDVVPRQAVDPEVAFHVEQTEELTNQFLRSLDFKKNNFLSPPKGILDGEPDLIEPFQGTPYVFDIETDRRTRRIKRKHQHHDDE